MDRLNSIEELQALVTSGFTDWKQYGAVYTKRLDNLILFNYTPEAMMNNRWTWLERVSRGLILDVNTGEVIARPFDKFFNWGEYGHAPAPNGTIKTITEKMDGSLGIGYRYDGKSRIATRGSFDSEQALWATEFVNRVHPVLCQGDTIMDDWTFLFEIIYPGNRIVVDYGNEEKLVLLALRNRQTGEYFPSQILPAIGVLLGVPVAPVHTFADMSAVLASTASIDHEGYVIEMSDGSRWKVKGDKYRALHKIISHVSFNAVLDALKADGWHEYRSVVPEEFWDEIDAYHTEITTVIDGYHATIVNTLTDDKITAFKAQPRKELALWVQQYPRELWGCFFNHFDGKYDRRKLLDLIPRRNVRTRVERGEA